MVGRRDDTVLVKITDRRHVLDILGTAAYADIVTHHTGSLEIFVLPVGIIHECSGSIVILAEIPEEW